MLRKNRIILICVCCTCATIVRAQSIRTDSTQTISNVTVEGRRPSQNIVSTSPLQSISADELRAYGAVDAGDALKHVAGVVVKDYGGIGGLKTVDVRGMGAQHTGVVYDGVEMGDCQTGQVDFGRLSTGNLSTIAVGIGQDGNIFHSAKTLASAATVYISSIFDMPSDSLGISAHTGSFGLGGGSLLGMWRFGKLNLGASGEYERADGGYPFSLRNGSQTISRDRSNSDLQSWRGELNMSFRPSDKHRLWLKAYGFTSDRGLPGAVIYDNPLSVERLSERNTFVQANYRGELSYVFSIKASAKWNYSYYRDHNVVATKPTEDKYIQQEGYLSTAVLAHPTRNIELSASQDFQLNYLSMSIPSCPFPTRRSWWSSLAAKYSNSRFTAVASVLYTHIRETVRTGEPSPGLDRTTPAFSLSYMILAGLRLRAGYKDIFRTPTLNDLYYTGVGRRNLRPEKNRQWNLGITFAPQTRGALRCLELTADGYYGEVSDKIVAVPKLFLWAMANVGRVRMLGLDLTARSGVAIAKGWEVDMSGNFSLTSAKNRTDTDELSYNDQIAYTPIASGNAIVTLATPWVSVSYSLIAVGRRYSSGYNATDYRMPGYADHSISVSRRFAIGKSNVNLSLDIRNLGGRNYEVVKFYPMPGTNWRLTAEVGL